MVSYLDVATIESTSHLDGRLSLFNRDGLFALLEPDCKVYLVPPRIDAIRDAHVDAIQDDGNGKATLRLREVNSIDDAEKLIGMHCLIEKPSDDEMNGIVGTAALNDFTGWGFLDETSGEAGRILQTYATAGNYLGEVVLDNDESSRSRLIPLADDFIKEAIKETKQLELQLPNGIFEL